MLRKRLLSLAVPVTVAVAAFLHARAIGALLDASLVGPVIVPASIAPLAEARAEAKSAAPILARNPFDHATRLVDDGPTGPGEEGATGAPPACPPGVRATIALAGDAPARSLAALELEGERIVQRDGGDAGAYRIAHIDAERVWLERDGRLCQAPVVARADGAREGAARPAPRIAGIERLGPHERAVDRATLERWLDAPGELGAALVPGAAGIAVGRVKPTGVLAALGLEAGDRIRAINGIDAGRTDELLAAYARLRTGTLDRWSVRVERGGAPVELAYVVR